MEDIRPGKPMTQQDTPPNSSARHRAGVQDSLRLAALQSTGLLDTPQESRFDALTQLACRLFDVPIALVSLVDDRRQWFKSRCGLDAEETPVEQAFCAHAIESNASPRRFGHHLDTGLHRCLLGPAEPGAEADQRHDEHHHARDGPM